ncbi:MAG: ribonuclease III domain-containing protein [Bacteroidales bacterium]|nr:ribonuclease III domain-containing protein [Bacteroidales bacterium]MDY0217706.1 ribonuclease III domain-containing protein [Bacteroidales bacterium]
MYELAFTHVSANAIAPNGKKINNERLEYLGDAILGAIIADYLYKKFPNADEGFLTESRSKIVSRAGLGKLAFKLGMDQHAIVSNCFSGSKSLSGDLFEAFIGAVYLDKGYEFTRKLIIDTIFGSLIDIEEVLEKENNFKSRLIEECQKEKTMLEFQLIKEDSHRNQKLFWVEIILDGKPTGIKACEYNIKAAEQLASEHYFIHQKENA